MSDPPRLDENQMIRSRITRREVEAKMRGSGMTRLEDVERIIVEHNGGITVPRKS